MNNVARIAPEIRDIHVPAPLRDLPLWCVWAYEQHPNEPKPRKVPQYTAGGRRHGKQGSPEDLAKLTTFALARDAAARRGMDGVGFALTRDTGIVALDFDNCVVDGVVNPVVANLVLNTYAEFSPSGKGVRAFFRGDLGNRKSLEDHYDFVFETFSSSGFVTVTGNMLPIVEILGNEDKIADVTPEVEQYCVERFGSAKPQAPSQGGDILDTFAPAIGLTIDESYELLQQLDPDMPRHDWMRVAMALSHEYSHSEEAFNLWNDWSSYGGSYPGYEGIRYQWDSLEDRQHGGRPITMATVIKMVKDSNARPNQAASVERVQERTAQLVAGIEPSYGVRSPEGYTGKFPVHSAAELGNAPPIDWWIKGVIPMADLFMIYGASGSGKSFVAIDMAVHVALGLPWRGLRVSRGKVIVIAAEGAGGYGSRIKAWAEYYGYDLNEIDVGIITVPPNFMESGDIEELAASIKLLGDVGLIIVDTLAQVTPGANENSSEDMGLALANSRVLATVTGATVGLVHHAGKDLGRGARGWSGARAAVDAEIEVTSEEEGRVRMIRITKQKDGVDNARYPFKLVVMSMGVDRYGEDITSCVAIEADPVSAPKEDNSRIRGLGRLEAHLLEVMSFFPGQSTAKMHEFIDKAVELMPDPEPGTRDTRRQRLVRSLREMARGKDSPIGLDGGTVIFFE